MGAPLTGTYSWNLPTGTIDGLSAIIPLTIGMPSSPRTIQASLQQVSDLLLAQQYFNVQLFAGDGSAVVPTGSSSNGYPYVEIPVACTIESWQVYADATGSVTANILKSTSAGFPPSSPLSGLGQPILTNQRKNNGVPTGTVSLAQNDVLQLQIASSSVVKMITISLRAKKS